MYFGIGGHPEFNIPMEEGLSFEDYELEFSRACEPQRILFHRSVLWRGRSPMNFGGQTDSSSS